MKQPNRVKAALNEGRIARGYNLSFPSPHIIEILAPFDFDFVWFDGEHGPFGLTDLEEHCRTAESVGGGPIAWEKYGGLRAGGCIEQIRSAH